MLAKRSHRVPVILLRILCVFDVHVVFGSGYVGPCLIRYRVVDVEEFGVAVDWEVVWKWSMVVGG